MPDRASADETKRLMPSSTDLDTDLGTRPLIIASNRGPVTFSRQADGSFDARKGSGGVVTAVTAVARERQADLDRGSHDRRRPAARR